MSISGQLEMSRDLLRRFRDCHVLRLEVDHLCQEMRAKYARNGCVLSTIRIARVIRTPDQIHIRLKGELAFP